MSKFKDAEKNAQQNRALAEKTGEPVITAIQKKKELDFTPFQKQILEAAEKMKVCDIVISVSKNRTSVPHTIVMQHVGNRLIPLSSLKK